MTGLKTWVDVVEIRQQTFIMQLTFFYFNEMSG